MPKQSADDDRPPQKLKNIDVEFATLGSILSKPDLFHEIADVIRPEYFSDEACGLTWRVMAGLIESGSALNMISIRAPLTSTLGWSDSDVSRLLKALVSAAVLPRAETIIGYAKIIRDDYVRREALGLSKYIQDHANDFSVDRSGDELLDTIESKLFAIRTDDLVNERAVDVSAAVGQGLDLVHATVKLYEDGQTIGVPSGLKKIEQKLGGLRDTDVIVIGARPGMGKSALMAKIARSGAAHLLKKYPKRPPWVLIFSLEMSADQLAQRWLSGDARVSLERMRLGQCTTDELSRLEAAAPAIRELPIRVDETGALTVAQMRTRARRLQRRKGLGLILIDYLQLISVPRDQREMNRVAEMSKITTAVKNLAKELRVPVVALSQLSRGVENREDKRPQLADLRESGSIEQDADVVLLLYREHYYLVKNPPRQREKEGKVEFDERHANYLTRLEQTRHQCECIIAKNRHGSEGLVDLHFVPKYTVFEDAEESPVDHGPAPGPSVDQIAAQFDLGIER